MSQTTQTASTVTLEIAGQDVTLPVKFGPGHVLTDNQAKVLDAAYQRQFTNNQNAGFKARQEALAKATTAEDRAKAQEALDKFTAAYLASLYTDYEPSIGGTRIGSMEKIRQDAAWRMWTARIKAHNDNVEAHGGPVAAQQSADYAPVIEKAGTNLVPGLKPKRDANGKVTVTVQEQRDSLVSRLLTMPDYADAIQEQVDIILAERGASKADKTASANTVDVADLI